MKNWKMLLNSLLIIDYYEFQIFDFRKVLIPQYRHHKVEGKFMIIEDKNENDNALINRQFKFSCKHYLNVAMVKSNRHKMKYALCNFVCQINKDWTTEDKEWDDFEPETLWNSVPGKVEQFLYDHHTRSRKRKKLEIVGSINKYLGEQVTSKECIWSKRECIPWRRKSK